MTNPGTRLALKLVHLMLEEKTPLEISASHNDFADDQGNPLFSPSTFSRTIRLLEEEGWVIENNSRFELSPEIRTLLCSYTSSFSSSPQVGSQIRNLALQTGESAAFAIWTGSGIKFTAKHEMAESFHYIPLGTLNKHNLHNGFNITCLAFQSRETRIKQFQSPATLSLVPTLESLESLAETIQSDQSLFWEDKVSRITAPVFYAEGLLAGVLGISFFNNQYSKEEFHNLIKKVTDTATEITRSLNL